MDATFAEGRPGKGPLMADPPNLPYALGAGLSPHLEDPLVVGIRVEISVCLYNEKRLGEAL